ncbi:alpha/beta hydrolase [Parendozoicomonas sp. Alg238-R29]|uniref:alpha/beta fold hydrolase n=1 Tax=Parendozoicomonas sp. Alg238-R29 TaxID=2993446 RepID=UPI00248D3B33|nr:alpha/beta hydrolase [Parendozoicomonas sp. Alg238-R29]
MESGQPLTIQTPDMTFSALAWGQEDAPVVLALHGWLDNAASFTRLAPLLKGVRVIAVDLAGHGLSDHRGAGGDYPLWSYVADVITIADALQLEKLHLLGHSMGAIVSMMTAATMPDRVASLTLIDGLWPGNTEARKTVDQLGKAIAWRTRLSRRPRSRFPSIEMAVKARMMAGFGKITAKAAEIIVRRGLKEDNGDWIWRSDSRLLAPTAMRMSLEQSGLLVSAVKVPAILIAAENGLVDSAAKQFADTLEHITVKRLAGEHHLHLEEQVDDVASVIQPHLSAAVSNAVTEES